MRESTRVLIGLGAGLALGIGIAASGNPALLKGADAIAPIGSLWVNAIRMTVVPLVVALLITGVASASDTRSLGRLGGRTIVVFVLLLVGTAIVIMPIAPSVFQLLPKNGLRPPLPPGAAEAGHDLAIGAQAQTFASWLTSLLPTNPVAAAANTAMVPLVLFTLCFGLAIAKSGEPTRTVLGNFFKSLGDAMLVLVRWVVLVAPVGVFALMVPVAAHTGAGIAGAIGFYIVAYSAGSLVVILLCYPVVAIAAGIPMREFARAALPAQLIAFSSSSSIATLPAQVEGAEQTLGLSEKTTGFVLPLAVSTFKLAAPVSWTVGTLFVAWFYGVSLGPGALATVAFAAVFLAFAAPGVPRGAWILLTPLFVTIGLPAEGIGLLIAVDAIPDTLATVLNVTGDMAAACLVARSDRTVEAARAGARAA